MCPLKREQTRRETQQWVMRRLPTADSTVEIGKKVGHELMLLLPCFDLLSIVCKTGLQELNCLAQDRRRCNSLRYKTSNGHQRALVPWFLEKKKKKKKKMMSTSSCEVIDMLWI